MICNRYWSVSDDQILGGKFILGDAPNSYKVAISANLALKNRFQGKWSTDSEFDFLLCVGFMDLQKNFDRQPNFRLCVNLNFNA